MINRLLILFGFIVLSAIQPLFAQDNCFTCDYDSMLQQLPKKQTAANQVELLTLLVDKADIFVLERNVLLIDKLLEANSKSKVIVDAPYVELRKGLIAWKDNNYNQALRYVKTAIELFDKQNKIIYDLLSNVRILFGLLNQQDERREYFENKLNQYQLSGPYQNTA